MRAILIALVCLCSVARGQSLEEQLDRTVLRAGLGQFWGAVVVARDGEILLARGYGYANENLDPITPDSLFDIASVSKMFTAAAILRLHEQGALNIDDPLSTFFPDLDPSAQSITIRHLLNHTSGKSDNSAIQPLNFEDRDEAVRRFAAAPSTSAPGTRFEYCNAGYVVLAAIIEQVTGEPFESHVRTHILLPAGMTSSGFLDGVGLDPARLTSRTVAGYGGKPRRGTLLDKSVEPWAWGLKGAGGIVTTVLDLVKWDRAIANRAILNPETTELWFTPAQASYAMGWQIHINDAGQMIQFHGGATRGYICEIRRYPAEGVFIAVLTNEYGRTLYPGLIAESLANVLWPVPEMHIKVHLDFAGRTLTQWKSVVASENVQMSVTPEQDDLVLTFGVTGDDRPLATITMNAPAAKRLANLIRRTLASGQHTPAPAGGVECGIYGYAYGVGPGRETVELDAVSWAVNPSYSGQGDDGRLLHDPRVTVTLVDESKGFWPIMMKLSDPDALRLAEQLAAAQ